MSRIIIASPTAATMSLDLSLFDVGLDVHTRAETLEYHNDLPFRFIGTIKKLTFMLTLQPKGKPRPVEAFVPIAMLTRIPKSHQSARIPDQAYNTRRCPHCS
jgi:hypothetical protein